LSIAANSDPVLQTIGMQSTWSSRSFSNLGNVNARPSVNLVTSSTTTYSQTVSGAGTEGFYLAIVGFSLATTTICQAWTFQRNILGHITQAIDPLGRQFNYTYASNNIDLLEVRETQQPVVGQFYGDSSLVGHWEYNAPTAPHMPSLYVDGSAQSTQYTYNSLAEPATITDANSNTTTYNYDSITPITIGGTASGSRTETITVGGHTATYVTTATDTLSTIAANLSAQINALAVSGISASAVGTVIQVNAPSGTTFSDTTQGAITISEVTPVTVSGSISSGTHTETITVASSNANYSATSASTPSSIATGLSAAVIALGLSGVTATPVGPIVEVSTPLGTSVTQSASGGITLTVGSPTSKVSYLAQTVGPLSGGLDVTNFTWNLPGTVSSTTDSEGYQLSYFYDNMDRRTSTVYPDGTSEKSIYDRLDVVLRSDRLGRWTRDVYDSIDQLICETDPLGRSTKYCWCTCGSLASLTDPAGNTTTWQHDLEGRITEKNYPDNSTVYYTYETDNSRLTTKKDALNQITNYFYNLDDTLQDKEYSSTVNATSNVQVSYDPTFSRTLSVSNVWGTNSYGFNPYNMIWFSGTPTTGDYVNVSVVNSSIAGGGQHNVQYQVTAADTSLTQLATDVTSAINSDSTLMTAGISATRSGIDITVSGSQPTSVSPNTNGVTTITVGGTRTGGDVMTLIVTNNSVSSSGTRTFTYNVSGTDTLATIATQLMNDVNTLNSYSISATQSGNSVIITSTSPYLTTYSTQVSAGATETLTQTGGATENAAGVVPNNFGNNRLASASNNVIANSTTTYSYDALGRTTNRSINASANSTTWSYDAISRITSEVNPLGTFGYTYVDQTPTDKGVTRLSSISYPNGQTTNFSWLPNIGDQRLQQISNLNPSSTIISQFNQAYDSAGEIKQWLQNQNSTNTHLSLGYDQASQLTGSTSDEGSQSNVYISGTPHAGDVVSVTAYDASLTGTTPKGQETATYTVLPGDTTTSIATGLKSAINTTMGTNLNIAATSSGSIITIPQTSLTPAYCTQFTCAVTGSGATTTIALGQSSAAPNLHKQLYYSYDCAGNRIGVQGDSSGSFPTGLTTTSTQYTYNNLNELTGSSAGGPILFQGTTTNPITSSAVNVVQTATVGGTIHAGDTLWLTVHDSGLSQAASYKYVVQSTDTTSTIAAAFVSLIGTTLSSYGISVSNSGAVITLTSKSAHVTSLTATTTGATESITITGGVSALATISPSNAFKASPTLMSGANTAWIGATSGGGVLGTAGAYPITISSATAQTLTYDANGNLTSDGTNSYAWDGENRLIKITYPGTGNNSQFTYDGQGRAVQIQEFSGGSSTSNLAFIWCGNNRCETRNGTNFGTVVNQFFSRGEMIAGTKYFYNLDHLGSV
jgi:YD repeat-containing protein